MIVCSCNVLTNQQILQAIATATTNRPPTVKEVYAGLRCRARCGGCVATIRKLREAAAGENGAQLEMSTVAA